MVDVLPVADTKNYDHRAVEFKNNTVVADAEFPEPFSVLFKGKTYCFKQPQFMPTTPISIG
jgi:hypothetical protein